MAPQPRIDNLNELFRRLFRGEEGNPIIGGWPRLSREDYFRMFFPEELCSEYLAKTKANLTWFFRDDPRNKAIRRSLIRMLEQDLPHVLGQTHRKCAAVLWPQSQHAAFRSRELWDVLSQLRLPPVLNRKYGIVPLPSGQAGAGSRLREFYDADPAAALARVILTLAIATDAPEAMIGRLWDSIPESPEDTSAPGMIRRGNLLYLSGRHSEAFPVLEDAARLLGRPAQTPEEAALYCRLGRMLATGDGHYTDLTAARKYLELGAAGGSAEAFYLLSKYAQGPRAADALEQAAALAHPGALRELGNACFYGISRPRDIGRAAELFRRGTGAPDENGAYCAYMLGRISEGEGNLPEAMSLYRIARDKGSADAWDRLSQLNPEPETAVRIQPSLAEDSSVRICIMNEATGANRVFAESLPGLWEVTVCGSTTHRLSDRADLHVHTQPVLTAAQALRDMAEELFCREREEFPELRVALLSRDREDNLFQAVEILRALDRIAQGLGDRKWELARKVCIYVEGANDYAGMMLDAAQSGARAVTFPLRLCDPDWDSADELFSGAPLFLPCLRDSEAREVHLVILGTGSEAMALLRRAIALSPPEGYRLSIRVFGPDAEGMEQRFAQLCPGISGGTPGIGCPQPTFHRCRLENGEAAALLQALRAQRQAKREMPDLKTAELLGEGNYFIVASGEDSLNIRLGTQLRSELLKLDPSFTNLPFIAVLVRSPTASWLAGNLSADGRRGSFSWHSRQDLYLFGSLEQYSFQALEGDLLERRAQAAHLRYADAGQPRLQALASYYRRQYNRDSSRAVALYLSTRLFGAGLTLPDWRLYAVPEELSRLAQAYRQWLNQPGSRELAARQEHLRWNCYMLSMGWERASVSQAVTYLQQGSTTHQLHLAKLHPFLCSWEELEDGSILQSVEDALRSRLPEKRIADPRIQDGELAAAAAELLDIT